jgi:lysine 6-dehydrogenase
MRIVMAGGAGAMALPAAIYCLEQNDLTQLVLADVDASKLDERIDQLEDERVTGHVLDLMDIKASAELFRGAGAVLNAAFATTCIPATKAALEAGVNYTDLGAYDPEEQLALHEGFREKGVTAVVSMGTAPGMSNVMAAYGAGKLDRIESIDIQDVCANMVPHDQHSRPLYWGYAIESIIEEFTDEAEVMEDGKIRRYPARSFPETVAFKPPVGPSQISLTTHPEIAMFARSFKDKRVQNVTWKIGFEPEFESKLQFLCAVGFGRTEPVHVDGQMVSPRGVLVALLNDQPPETKRPPDFRGHMVVVVKGEEAGQKVEYTVAEYATAALTERMQKRGVFSSYRTGIYVGIATMMLARGNIAKKGVFYPEVSIPAERFLKEAARAGIDVEVSKKIAM